MTNTTFRDADPASPADAATLAAIGARTFVETFGHLYAPADLEAFVAADHSPEAAAALLAAPGTAALFVEAAGETAGYAVIAPNRLPHVPPDLPAHELKRLYLLAPLHGRGLADALIAWAEERARCFGAEALTLSVFSENHRAMRFYTRHGFAHLGDYHFMVGAQADLEHVWMKRL